MVSSRNGAAPLVLIGANTTWYVHNFRARLIRQLLDDGYRVVVYAPRDAYVDRLRALGVEHEHLALDNAGVNPLREAVTLGRIAATLSRLRPQAALTFTPKVNLYFSLASRGLRIPLIANVSGLGRGFVAGGWIQRVSRVLYREAFRHPHHVFFQNEDDRAEFTRAGLVEAARTSRLPGSGVDVERFAPRPRDPGGPFVFLLVARMLRDKGIGEYVEAARRIRAERPDVEFRLLGFLGVDNPSAVGRAEMDAWVEEGVVVYRGVSDDVAAEYAAADCVVLPSYYREGVPRSLLEAASMAKPIITTDAIGCRDTIDDGVSGWLCVPRDVESLVDRMRRMLALSADARAAMGAAGREKMCRSFDERIVLARYAAGLDAIVAARPARSLARRAGRFST